jgi:heme/copper-type cytochrome/quinol oxidase subunit 2
MLEAILIPLIILTCTTILVVVWLELAFKVWRFRQIRKSKQEFKDAAKRLKNDSNLNESIWLVSDAFAGCCFFYDKETYHKIDDAIHTIKDARNAHHLNPEGYDELIDYSIKQLGDISK